MKLLRNSPGLQWLLCLRESCLLFYLYIHFVFESSFSSSLLNVACSTPHSITGGWTLLSVAPEEMRQGVALGHVCVCHRNCIQKLGKKLKMFLTRGGCPLQLLLQLLFFEWQGVKAGGCFCHFVNLLVLFIICLIKPFWCLLKGQDLEKMCFEYGYWCKILMSGFLKKKKVLSARLHVSTAGHLLTRALWEGLRWWLEL